MIRYQASQQCRTTGGWTAYRPKREAIIVRTSAFRCAVRDSKRCPWRAVASTVSAAAAIAGPCTFRAAAGSLRMGWALGSSPLQRQLVHRSISPPDPPLVLSHLALGFYRCRSKRQQIGSPPRARKGCPSPATSRENSGRLIRSSCTTRVLSAISRAWAKSVVAVQGHRVGLFEHARPESSEVLATERGRPGGRGRCAGEADRLAGWAKSSRVRGASKGRPVGSRQPRITSCERKLCRGVRQDIAARWPRGAAPLDTIEDEGRRRQQQLATVGASR